MKAEDLFWLAVNAYHEARGEVFDGQVAVCHVVLNRAQGDSLAGADHYYAFAGPNAIKEPSWVQAGKMREVARIGNHVFFRS